MDSFFILYLVVGIYMLSALIRLLRGRPLTGLIALGEDYRDEYRISAGRVYCEKEGDSWVEPLANYDNVLWRVETVRRRNRPGGRHRRDHVFQILELRHGSNRDRDVNVYTSREERGMRGRWEESARAFMLPAVRDMGDGRTIRREPEELGRSLRELAAAGRIKSSMKHRCPPPAGIRWQQHEDCIVISIRKASAPYVLVALGPFLFSVFVGFMVPADPLTTMAVMASLCLLFGIWLLTSFRIQITPKAVSVSRQLGPVPFWRQSLSLDCVEDVIVGPALLSWGAVLIEEADRTLRVHPLSDTDAEWLVHFVRSAIMTTPSIQK